MTPHLCELISIMMSVPTNTGWVERGYSTLEMICEKRRNNLKVQTMESLLFLPILKEVYKKKVPEEYTAEINNFGVDVRSKNNK